MDEPYRGARSAAVAKRHPQCVAGIPARKDKHLRRAGEQDRIKD